MKVDAEHFDVIIRTVLKERQLTQRTETVIKKHAGNKADDEGHNGIGGKTAGANTDGGKQAGEQNKTEVRTDGRPRINARCGRKMIDGKVVNKRWQKRNQRYCKSAKEFSRYNL